jgi:hypothetical protein
MHHILERLDGAFSNIVPLLYLGGLIWHDGLLHRHHV